jgi:addiction module HigA family antidote
MRLEARKYLRDIQVAAERIERFTRGKGFEQYLADEMLRSAVERQFSIIGEALSRLEKDSPDAEMALRLSAALGGSAESWLRMQAAYDLWRASRKRRPRIAPLKLAA